MPPKSNFAWVTFLLFFFQLLYCLNGFFKMSKIALHFCSNIFFVFQKLIFLFELLNPSKKFFFFLLAVLQLFGEFCEGFCRLFKVLLFHSSPPQFFPKVCIVPISTNLRHNLAYTSHIFQNEHLVEDEFFSVLF